LTGYDFDVVVIGAGIHGAGVAQAAAAAGYQVALLEKEAIAHGTSSRSSKLIHGGLRYLETAHLGLVRESLRERELLLRLAPALVRLVPFYIPVYKDTSRRSWQIRSGLGLYALLTGFTPHALFTTVTPDQWTDLDGLARNGLRHVFRYWDAQTDDAALTRAVVRSAQDLGAVILCPADLQLAEHLGNGFNLRYAGSGVEERLRCRTLINTAGPWVNEVLNHVVPPVKTAAVELVQGTHIQVRGEVRKGVYYVEASDKRGVLIMPRLGHTLVGTTEHPFQGDPADVRPLDHEIAYLVATLTRYFPQLDATLLDSFAGLRVLPTGADTAFTRSRETMIVCDDETRPQLVSVYGGKLTAYRATAAKVVFRLRPTLGSRKPLADTSRLPLTPSPEPGVGA